MTEIEKAARIALEALRHGVSQLNGIGIPMEADPLHTAIAALTQALATAEPEVMQDGGPPCKRDPRAPHGFLRDTSHAAGRYVCECEFWEPPATPERKLVATPDHNGALVPASPADMQVYDKIAAGYWTERKVEPVAYREKITGRLCAPEDTHRRKFPMCYEPLYTSPQVSEDTARLQALEEAVAYEKAQAETYFKLYNAACETAQRRLQELVRLESSASTSPQVPEDTARLDWIERQYLEDLSIRLVMDAPNDGQYYVCGDSGTPGYGKTLREAIDAARKKS